MTKLMDWLMEWVFPVFFLVALIAIGFGIVGAFQLYQKDMQECLADGHPAYYCRSLINNRHTVVVH